MELVTAKQMYEIDSLTQSKLLISQDVLIEKAAMELLTAVKEKLPGKILIVVGNGNNGADGIALGRLLLECGENPDLYLCSKASDLKESPKLELNRYRLYGGNIVEELVIGTYDIIVDCIFGVGLNKEVVGDKLQVISEINVMHQSGAYVISADIPSGIDATNGNVLGIAVEADLTVTFGYAKIGCFMDPGRLYSKKVKLASIGMDYKRLGMDKPKYFTIPLGETVSLPKRNPMGNKGSFGRIAIVAGSRDMAGASYLSAYSSFLSGSGLVEVITPIENRQMFLELLPETVLFTYDAAHPPIDEIVKHCNHADCVIAGPGLSVTKHTKEMVYSIVENVEQTILLDADALNCIAQMGCGFNQEKHRNRKVIITPHPGEFSRLLKKTISEIKSSYIELCMDYAKRNGIIMVGKGSTSIVTDGEFVYINNTGSDAMAKAGSGDVLTGVIASLAGQGASAFDAAWKGVFLHGLAGNLASLDLSNYSLLASDIAKAIPEAIQCME